MGMSAFRFEKLAVWQRSIDFADRVYEITTQLPSDERFGLTSQMRRAAISISSNIAEGAGRSSDVEFNRFVEIAYGSLMEVVSQAALATRRKYIKHEDHLALREAAEELARMLSGLKTSLRKPSPGS
jgi:four helix bundle protein